MSGKRWIKLTSGRKVDGKHRNQHEIVEASEAAAKFLVPRKHARYCEPDEIPTGGESESDEAKILGQPVKDVVAAIAAVESEDELLELAELEGSGKNRKGVHDAIDARLEALADQDGE